MRLLTLFARLGPSFPCRFRLPCLLLFRLPFTFYLPPHGAFSSDPILPVHQPSITMRHVTRRPNAPWTLNANCVRASKPCPDAALIYFSQNATYLPPAPGTNPYPTTASVGYNENATLNFQVRHLCRAAISRRAADSRCVPHGTAGQDVPPPDREHRRVRGLLLLDRRPRDAHH